jgi:hypothetical protein
VRQHLQQLDFSQRCDGEAVLLVMHQNLLQRKDAAGSLLSRHVDFTKSTLSEFLHHFVVADFAASLESPLQGKRRRCACRVGHVGGGVGWCS